MIRRRFCTADQQKALPPARAMFTHNADTNWQEVPLEEALANTVAGLWKRLDAIAYWYDDELPSFQCAFPCAGCD